MLALYEPEGVNVIADVCEARFKAGGWEVERAPHLPAEGEPQLVKKEQDHWVSCYFA